MIIRVLFLMLVMVVSGLSCAEQAIDTNKGREIADNKLRELASSNYFSAYHVDVSALPDPTLEVQGNKLLVDYKDDNQNAWIVVTVHPDGLAEVSYSKIRD